jgi:asparagine synthase (glutamine-hydrolysing)
VYAGVGDGVLFAEHERDLIALLPSTPSPDRLALLQWVENGLTPAGRTLYEGLHTLPAGHWLRMDDRGFRDERWWHLRFMGTDTGSHAILAEKLRASAFAAIERAAANSERPAVKLSGGLDSACIAAGLTASGFADGRALALAGTFSDHPATDESELIASTALHTHLPLERIAFDPTTSMLAPALEHIVRWRLPPATPNLFLWRPLMERARALGVDRILDGEGGDELFGFAPYLIADMLRTGRLGATWSLTKGIPGIGPSPSIRTRMRIVRSFGLSPLMPPLARRCRERSRVGLSGSIVPAADAAMLAELRTASQSSPRDGPCWWRSQVESMIDDRDLLGMGAHFRREDTDEAIERRHPFLYDLDLIETALRLPPQAQFDAIRDRPLLRDGLIGKIPEAVRTRHQKSYFTTVVLAGIRADEADLIGPLGRPDAPVRAYVADEALGRKIAVAPDDRRIQGAAALWRVAIINRWLAFQADTSH